MKHVVIVEDDHLISYLPIFSCNESKIIRSFESDDMFKDDPEHKRLMKAKKKASDEFYNYEFDKRHNHKEKQIK